MEDPPLASGIDSSRGVSPKVGIITQDSSVYIYWSFHSNFGESSLRKKNSIPATAPTNNPLLSHDKKFNCEFLKSNESIQSNETIHYTQKIIAREKRFASND